MTCHRYIKNYRTICKVSTDLQVVKFIKKKNHAWKSCLVPATFLVFNNNKILTSIQNG